MAGGATPDESGNAILLSLRRMNTIRSLDADAGQAVCDAGVILQTFHEAAEEAGRMASVKSVDVVELAPPLDRDGQTARLAATTVWRILRGFAEG